MKTNKWDIELIEEHILECMKILNISYMPSRKDLEKISRSDLITAIGRHGGFVYIRDVLGLSKKNFIYKYSNNDIKNSILLVSNNTDYMPSAKEIIEYYGDSSIHNAIVRTYGYYGWANKLNLSIKDSDTALGIDYQNICYNKLKSLNYEVSYTKTLAPYDLIINEDVKIDVKAGCAYYLRGSRCHTFALNKPYPSCDIYICFALNEDGDKIERIFVIPSKFLKLHTLSIGENSKYNKYIDRYDYINKYISLYEEII